MPLKAASSFSPSSLCCRCETRLLLHPSRHLTTSTPFRAPGNPEDAFANALRSRGTKSSDSSKPTLSSIFSQPRQASPSPPARSTGATKSSGVSAARPSANLSHIFGTAQIEASSRPSAAAALYDSYHLHVYATKHNTHITFTRPNREPLLSVSAGNLGFRKSHRGSFDAAYQLSSFAMAKIQEKGFTQQMEKLEVVLRGFGPGREAFQKALLGSEGKGIKAKVTRVTDSTRLKFGGTKSKNVRRL